MSKQGVMERLSWYQELRNIFIAHSENNTISKAKLLECLTDCIEKLPLKTLGEYYDSTCIQGFTFEEVYNQIETMPRTMKWDEMLDSFAYLSIYTRVSEGSGPINLIQVKSEKRFEDTKPKEKDTLKEDFPLVKFYNLSEITMGQNLKFLSLGGNYISNASFEFPTSLIALNLSYNVISDFQPIKPLSNLKFLNISYNLIENMPDITGIITLNELFISNNKLNTANFLFSIKNLTILDLGHNILENFEDIAMLSVSSKLIALSLLDNPLHTKSGYSITIKSLFSRVLYLDNSDIQSYSNFKVIGFSSEPKSPQKSVKNTILKADLQNLSPYRPQNSIVSTDNQSNTTKLAKDRNSPIDYRSGTPKIFNFSSVKHMRSRSNGPCGTSQNLTGLNNSCKKSIQNKHKNVVGSKNNTGKSQMKIFGDPFSVMMIGPPAVKNIFRPQSSSKNPIVDTTKLSRHLR
ncbi:hypothetical protein SteCoe_11978 [Stentor coeruleus]|uniref:Uncharacterized protein n=1 Tax=Stentor coeruleus TaxID=5963 RepID=A0A1R2CBX9_9CILI|nr:hypothetical protein SteCoe_11978 [Stentor coeruleus]